MRTLSDVEFGIGYVGDEPAPRWAERARWLEDTPVAQLWLADERFYRDPWVLLSLMGQATRRLRLGTCVTDPFVRHPALTANAIATLSEATGGRAVLGMGAGISGFAAMGIDRRRPATALREATGLIRSLVRGEHVDLDGRIVRFRDSELYWDPPHPVPICIAGRGPKILEVGGEVGDGVIVASFASGPGLQYALDRVETGLARRDPALGPCKRISWLYTCVGADRAAAREPVKRGIAVALWGSLPVLDQIGVELPGDLRDFMTSTGYSLTPQVIGRAMALIPDEIVEDFSLSGTPEDCAAKIAALVDRGIDQIAIWPFAPEDADVDTTVRTFVEEVIPMVLAA